MTRRRLDPEVRRQELLDAAERLLRKRGAAVRVEDVARAAGAAKGTIYHYFDTWDDLLEAIRSRQNQALEAEAAHLLALTPPVDWDSLLPGVASLLVDHILALERLHEVLHHGPFAQARPLPQSERPAARIADLLRAGQESGAFAPVDPDRAGALVFALIHETADAVAAGTDRERALSTLSTVLRRIVTPGE